MTGEKVALAMFASDIKAAFSPRAVEQRDDPVIENVKEVAQRSVGSSQPLNNQRSIGIRKNSLRTGQTHELHGHLDGAIGGALHPPKFPYPESQSTAAG